MSRVAANNSVIRISPLLAWGEGGRALLAGGGGAGPTWQEVEGRPPEWASPWEGRPKLEPWWDEEIYGPHVPLTLRYGWAHPSFEKYLFI